MKLYFSKGACSLAVRIILHELNISAQYINVDLKNKKIIGSDEDYLTINPKGTVPFLELDSGQKLSENSVIQQYLADHAKSFSLLPEINNFQRYHVLEWLNYISTDLHKSFTPLFNAKVPQDLKNSVFIPILEQKLEHVNASLHHKNYLCGKDFTLPDGYLFVVLRWLKGFNINIQKWENLHTYMGQLMLRPSIIRALEEEGLD